MIRAQLRRHPSTDEGTFGVLSVDRKVFFTGELPWRENKHGISCIPPGTYEVAWSYSPHFQRFCYELQDVKDRSDILLHAANLVGDKSLNLKSEVEGCIAVGKKLGFLYGQRAVLASVSALTELEIYLAQEPFILEIAG